MSENSLFDLSGRTAFVSGASRGLGQQFSIALAAAGADIVMTARKAEDLAATAAMVEELGRKAMPVPLEVRTHDSIKSAVAKAWELAGSIDILVNNAGCNTNLRGVFFVAQEHAARMVQRKYGRIINIGSVTCVNGYAGLGPYCGSRGGVKQLTMSLADDWGPHGVTVNCLAPGWFKTKQNAVMYEDEGWVDYLSDRIPLKRPGSPGDLHGAVVFLSSEASAYMTGQTLLIDGGISTGAVRAVPKK